MINNAEHYLGDLEAASKLLPTDKPYIMMNLMKFKPKAQYPAKYDSPSEESLTGRDAYIMYKDKFIQRAAELSVELSFIFLGKAYTQIVAGPQEGENFDVALLVRFPSFAAFRSIVEDKEYVDKIQPHRLASLQEFRSFSVTEMADF